MDENALPHLLSAFPIGLMAGQETLTLLVVVRIHGGKQGDIMWNGKLAPPLVKHYDGGHGSFAEHELDNGGSFRVLLSVYCNVNPVTQEPLTPSDIYYVVEFTLHDGKAYFYLVPAESDRSQPNADTVKQTVDAYNRNKVPGGRVMEDYIDLDATDEKQLERLEELQEELVDSRRSIW